MHVLCIPTKNRSTEVVRKKKLQLTNIFAYITFPLEIISYIGGLNKSCENDFFGRRENA